MVRGFGAVVKPLQNSRQPPTSWLEEKASSQHPPRIADMLVMGSQSIPGLLGADIAVRNSLYAVLQVHIFLLSFGFQSRFCVSANP